jgi:hypothetical protein
LLARWLAIRPTRDLDRSSVLNVKTAFGAKTTLQARQLCGSFQAMKCHCRVISICTPRPSQLHVVVGFGLLWRAERLRSLCEKPPILLPELASVGRYLSILENNAWQNGCTWHTFLSVRAEEKIAACCRVLSTSSPTSFTGCRRGTLSGASQIFLRKPCISATDTSRPQREHPRSRV